MGKCLLGESKKFASKYNNLLMMFGNIPVSKTSNTNERSRFDKRRKAKVLPEGVGSQGTRKPLPAGNRGKIKDKIVRPKTDKKGKVLRTKAKPNVDGPMSQPGKSRPIMESKSVLPEKLTRKESQIRRKIKKENAKIAMLTQQEAEQATVRGKGLKGRAKMKIKANPDFAKQQGTVNAKLSDLPQVDDPSKLGQHNYSQTQRKRGKKIEAKELDKSPKRRARKNVKIMESLPLDKTEKAREKVISRVMKSKKLNRRGAESLLRKSPDLFKTILKAFR